MATESRFTNVSRVMSTLIPHLVHDSPFPHNSQTPPSKPVKCFDLLTRSSYGLVYTFAFSFSKQLSRFDSSVVNSRNKATKLSSKLSELIGERLAFIPAETDEPLERTRIERAHQYQAFHWRWIDKLKAIKFCEVWRTSSERDSLFSRAWH